MWHRGRGGTGNTLWTPGPTFPLFLPLFTLIYALCPRPLFPRLAAFSRSSSIVCPMTGELALGKDRERQPFSPTVSVIPLNRSRKSQLNGDAFRVADRRSVSA